MPHYYKSISKNVLICYIISVITFVIMFVLSYAILYNTTPQALGTINIILIVLSFVLVGVASFISCSSMKNAVISSENAEKTEKIICAPESLALHVKRIASFPILMSLVGFGISLGGGFGLSLLIDLFTSMRSNDFPLYATIIKIPLFIGFAVFLIIITYNTGLDDAATESFNPHFMLIVLILSFAFMMPVTVSDHMYDNYDDRGNVDYSNPSGRIGVSSSGKMIYNVQTVFSSNIDLYKDNRELTVNEKFSGLWVVISILLSTAIQIFIAMPAYYIGRKKYYKKHPSLLENKITNV